MALIVTILSLLLISTICFRILKLRNANIWIWSYLTGFFNKEKPDLARPIHIYFALADHFEPFHNKASKDKALRRVREWSERYPKIVDKFIDSDGNHPKHTIFYPVETYDPEIMSMLNNLCKEGYFDLEIHLHHNNDTAENLKKTLNEFKNTLFFEYDLLRKDDITNKIVYGFIHGNWALDNSRRDGKWCGINNELTILRDTGCFADFTMPSAPSDTQTAKINSIYYAIDDPEKPKSHNKGIDASINEKITGDLLIIQGPLTLNWKKRKLFFLPGIENGDVCYGNEITPHRIKFWIKNAPALIGEPNHRFLKVYTHGCEDDNLKYLLNNGLESLYKFLCAEYSDGKNYKLHFVSAYEMYKIIRKIEAEGISN